MPALRLPAAQPQRTGERDTEALIATLREFSVASIGWRNSWAVSVFRMCNWALRLRTEFRPFYFLLRLGSLGLQP